MTIQKIFGLSAILCIIFGALSIVGLQLFIDVNSMFFVFGGATGYSLLKSRNKDWVKNLGEGGVYFGWLGTLIGLIAITGNKFDEWGNLDIIGRAFAVAMLTIFYGYVLKLITMAFEK